VRIKFPKIKRSTDRRVAHRSEGFRKKAFLYALLMAIAAFSFALAVLHFIGALKIF
jgi:hypothetical protein